jgi:hypothetical protein
METYSAHRAPWTCFWGRFGSRSAARPGKWLLANSFWLCRHPQLETGPRPVERGEGDACPLWLPAAERLGHHGEQEQSAPKRDGEQWKT